MAPPIRVSRIFLVGMMGSGKSSIGGQLAARLDYAFVDTDDEIAGFANQSVAEIFRTDGEAKFRAYERKIVESFAFLEYTVVATGGGLPLFDGHLELRSSNYERADIIINTDGKDVVQVVDLIMASLNGIKGND